MSPLRHWLIYGFVPNQPCNPVGTAKGSTPGVLSAPSGSPRDLAAGGSQGSAGPARVARPDDTVFTGPLPVFQ